MDAGKLKSTANEMLRIGILAADESHGTIEKPGTIEKRLKAAAIDPTEENVNAWRELVRDTPHLEEYISAVILEMSRVSPDAAIYAEKGIVPGVKIDKGIGGKVGLYDEKLTVGLDGLAERLNWHKLRGARFAKWRTVTQIGENTPTEEAIRANMDTQIKYALLCQENGIAPICEPEVLIDGNHTIRESYDVTKQVLINLFEQANKEGAYLPGMILKTSMVIWGKEYDRKRNAEEIKEVADKTVKCLMESVPKDVAAIVFLSGGQTDIEAVMHLNEINKIAYKSQGEIPWPISFSYSRAIQNDAMEIWGGKPENVRLAQEALLERARASAFASKGALSPNFQYDAQAPK